MSFSLSLSLFPPAPLPRVSQRWQPPEVAGVSPSAGAGAARRGDARLRGRPAGREPGGSRWRVMTDPFILYCLSELKYYLWRTVPSGKEKKKKSSLTELTQPLLLGQ